MRPREWVRACVYVYVSRMDSIRASFYPCGPTYAHQCIWRIWDIFGLFFIDYTARTHTQRVHASVADCGKMFMRVCLWEIFYSSYVNTHTNKTMIGLCTTRIRTHILSVSLGCFSYISLYSRAQGGSYLSVLFFLHYALFLSLLLLVLLLWLLLHWPIPASYPRHIHNI